MLCWIRERCVFSEAARRKPSLVPATARLDSVCSAAFRPPLDSVRSDPAQELCGIIPFISVLVAHGSA